MSAPYALLPSFRRTTERDPFHSPVDSMSLWAGGSLILLATRKVMMTLTHEQLDDDNPWTRVPLCLPWCDQHSCFWFSTTQNSAIAHCLMIFLRKVKNETSVNQLAQFYQSSRARRLDSFGAIPSEIVMSSFNCLGLEIAVPHFSEVQSPCLQRVIVSELDTMFESERLTVGWKTWFADLIRSFGSNYRKVLDSMRSGLLSSISLNRFCHSISDAEMDEGLWLKLLSRARHAILFNADSFACQRLVDHFRSSESSFCGLIHHWTGVCGGYTWGHEE
jgi:hypothetical protein